MPQVDVSMFNTLIVVTFTLYFIGFFIFNVTIFDIFFKSQKMESRRHILSFYKGVIFKQTLINLNKFNWITNITKKII